MTLRVLVLGGYGIFGARLCRLLSAYPALTLLVSGRNLAAARALCASLQGPASCEALQLDRDHLQAADLQKLRVNLLIDASGPFQAYGHSPYGVVRACLEAGTNYMDFADGADFVDGIVAFDTQARQRGLFVLSGVSSFPVLTAAVVRLLSTDLVEVHSIRGGIAPSPFAVVGRNVIRAIAGYAGQPLSIRRGGKSAQAHALTESCDYTIAPPGRVPLRTTRFSLVEVPDLLVLPKLWPHVQTVWMGAGPVPEILHRMLNGLAWLVRWRLLPTLRPFSLLFHTAIRLLRWGEHRGGMFVEVQGATADGRHVQRSWHLLAEGEDGPYIPCMALQAVVQKVLAGQVPAAGARAASGDLEVEDYLALFATRNIHVGQREHQAVPDQAVFPYLLGAAYQQLPPALQIAHGGVATLTGRASVQRGTGWWARAVCAAFRFPAAIDDVAVQVEMQRHSRGERWVRSFGEQRFASELSAGSGSSEWLLVEQFGPLRFRIALVLDAGKLYWVVRGARAWGIPLPMRWLPDVESHEFESQGRFHFHVDIRHPWTGLIVQYRGWLEPQRP